MFELRLAQGIRCPACDGFTHDHEGECPQENLAAFCQAAALREYRCPKCHAGFVALNRDDFYECRKCHGLFSTGPACGEDVEALERTYLLGDVAVPVVVMTGKGRGRFRDDEIIKALRAEVKRAIERREPRKRPPTTYQRLMREVREEQKLAGVDPATKCRKS